MIDYVQCIKNLSHVETEGLPHLSWEYSPEVIGQILSKTIRENIGPARYFQNRSLFYVKGRYWQFFNDGGYLKYSSSIDGITWSSPSLSICLLEFYSQYSVKVNDNRIYLVAGNDDNHYHYFWLGEPYTDGTIYWTTNQVGIPPPSGPSWSDVIGNPDITVNSSGIPFISYQLWDFAHSDFHLCVSKANNVSGTSWSLILNIPLEYDVANSSLVRLNSGRIMLVYINGNSTFSRLWSGASWSSKEMNIYPYQYHGALSDNEGLDAIQCLSDKCQNVYVVWQWKNDLDPWDELGYPATLRLHVFNLTTSVWSTQIIVSGLTGPVYPTICKRVDEPDFHIYYAIGANIYRISILNCTTAGVGEIQPTVLVATESGNVTHLQTQDFIPLEEDTVCSIGLTYNIGTTLKFTKDVLPYTKNDSEVVEVYRKKQGDAFFSKLGEIEYDYTSTDFVDTETLETGTYEYALRIRDVEDNYSKFSYITIYHTKVDPQIEFAGRGGFNALRHSIYTFHSETDADKSMLNIKLWNTSNMDASKAPSSADPDMKLHGSKEIESKNIEPFTTDTFISGSELDAWKRIYSIISKTDKNTSARIRLKGGR
jgi:hypothetical protein